MHYGTLTKSLFPAWKDLKRINFDKYHPGDFGKVGMRHHHLKRNRSFCPTVNLDKLWTLVREQTRVNAAKSKTGAAPIIDVVRSATTKFWGRESPKAGCHVKARFFSRRAEKIKGVGGASVIKMSTNLKKKKKLLSNYSKTKSHCARYLGIIFGLSKMIRKTYTWDNIIFPSLPLSSPCPQKPPQLSLRGPQF
ncbi:60S ribosomal protein L27a [Myotis davidii]|uniref:Large ribosomal subunit protein uL15 n=1 Tax=Myotis davidii TaxID=225400 RepID=L5M866_MYODS|nr:60S ribosomal protein L27a [Myotis davidii]